MFLAHLPQLPASANSLVVEPTFCQRVSDSIFDEGDRKMRTIVTRARDQVDDQYYVPQLHCVPLVYRNHNTVQSALVISSSGGLRILLIQEAHYGASGHLGTSMTAAHL